MFSTPSSLSISLTLENIFYLKLGNCPQMKMFKIKFQTYQEACFAEASSLACLDLRKSKFYTYKLDLWISGLVLLVLWYLWYSGTSGTLVFWYFVKLGFHFLGDLSTKKVR
jgi:hypothetical protein